MKTEGHWSIEDERKYFIAGPHHVMADAVKHTNLLIAVNELSTERSIGVLERWIEEGKCILIDSGVFALCADYARKAGIHFDEARAMPVESIPGFDALWQRYIWLVETYRDHLWGYIEMDFGSKAEKTALREKLEKAGLRPIPVYHPIADGWDYFDELAAQYDRICMGNLGGVGIGPVQRKVLISMIARRLRDYPQHWIHLLGVTPNEWAIAFPVHSMDSSAWNGGERWGRVTEQACLKAVGGLLAGYAYRRGSNQEDPDGQKRGRILASDISSSLEKTMNQIGKAYADICEQAP